MNKNICLKYLLIVALVINLVTLATTSPARNSRLPKSQIIQKLKNVEIKAFFPKGIQISLKDFNGLQMFRFNGNINAPIQISENGSIFKVANEAVDGVWTVNVDNVKLHIGDSLNFWVEALVSGDIYSFDQSNYIIHELIYQPRETEQTINVIKSTCKTHENGYITQQIDVRTKVIGCNFEDPSSSSTKTETKSMDKEILASQLTSLQEKVQSLESQIQNLKDFCEKLPNTENSTPMTPITGTRLLLTGDQPPKTNTLESIKQLVVEKLNLQEFETKILQAYETKNGIVFVVPTTSDKRLILKTAETRLINSPYKIRDPDTYNMVTSGPNI